MDDFTQRHLGASTPDQQQMLSLLGFASLDELTNAIVPAAIRLTEPLQLVMAIWPLLSPRMSPTLSSSWHRTRRAS